MQIWVDADACPNVIKEILYRAAERTKTSVVLVANQSIKIPVSAFIQTIRVDAGFDIADNEIVQRVRPSDLVITADIPLAAEVLEKNAYVLTPRGESLTGVNIKERLTMRDFMETLRSSGIHSGGPSSLNQRDRQVFANALDNWLQRKKQRAV